MFHENFAPSIPRFCFPYLFEGVDAFHRRLPKPGRILVSSLHCCLAWRLDKLEMPVGLNTRNHWDRPLPVPLLQHEPWQTVSLEMASACQLSSLGVTAWGACGGRNWDGPTCCEDGYRCVPAAWRRTKSSRSFWSSKNQSPGVFVQRAWTCQNDSALLPCVFGVLVTLLPTPEPLTVQTQFPTFRGLRWIDTCRISMIAYSWCIEQPA